MDLDKADTGRCMTALALIRRILLLDLVLLLAAILVAWLWTPLPFVLGIAVGGLLGTANLAVLSWLCHRAVQSSDHRWRYVAAMGGKFLLLVALVFVCIRWVPMDLMAFVIGLSLAGVAIVVATSWVALRRMELTA